MRQRSEIARAVTVISAVILVLAACSPAFGQKKTNEKRSVAIEIKVQKEVRTLKDGKWVVELQPADKSKRDDVLVYTIIYRNRHDFAAKNVSIVDPIPDGTVYVMGSASGDGTETTFSTDGGKTYQKPPITYTIVKPGGKKEEAPAPPEKYTHIKWLITTAVAPGRYGTVSFKVKVK